MNVRRQATNGHSVEGDAERLPDWRKLGVILRAVVAAEVLRVLAVLLPAGSWHAVSAGWWSQAVVYEPVLLTALAVLALLSPALHRLPYSWGVLAELAIVGGSVLAWVVMLARVTGYAEQFSTVKALGVGWLVTAAILFYFDWRHYRLSPALTEARLIALQSRIRPHFLFNSLNSVLALVRAEPRGLRRCFRICQTFTVPCCPTRARWCRWSKSWPLRAITDCP